MKTISIIILIVGTIQAQSIYELRPGVKGNQIVLQIVNTSETETVSLPKPHLKSGSEHLKFSDNIKETIIINPKEAKEIVYIFDVEYNIGKTEADTIEFIITDNKSIYQTKQFILQYTIPTEYKLEQNYPNPFSPATKIRYQIPDTGTGLAKTELKVFDILGNEVATLEYFNI